MIIQILLICAWVGSGILGASYWWYQEFRNLEESEFACFVGALLGPFAWLAGIWVHDEYH